MFQLFDLDEKINPHAAHFPIKPTWEKLTDDEYFTFAFVRNPWDRLVSLYRDKIRGVYSPDNTILFSNLYGARFHKGMTFNKFAIQVCKIPDCISEIHFRSQHRRLIHNGKLLPNFVGRYENLAEDFEKVCEITGLSLKLPHLFDNVSKDNLKTPWVKTDYRTYYNEELAELVGKRFSKDIDYFGYTFDE